MKFEPQHVLDKTELNVLALSQSAERVGALPHKERRALIARARKLRDRARTQYVKQVAKTRAATGYKRGFSGTANERSRAKAELLGDAVAALQQG